MRIEKIISLISLIVACPNIHGQIEELIWDQFPTSPNYYSINFDGDIEKGRALKSVQVKRHDWDSTTTEYIYIYSKVGYYVGRFDPDSDYSERLDSIEVDITKKGIEVYSCMDGERTLLQKVGLELADGILHKKFSGGNNNLLYYDQYDFETKTKLSSTYYMNGQEYSIEYEYLKDTTVINVNNEGRVAIIEYKDSVTALFEGEKGFNYPKYKQSWFHFGDDYILKYQYGLDSLGNEVTSESNIKSIVRFEKDSLIINYTYYSLGKKRHKSVQIELMGNRIKSKKGNLFPSNTHLYEYVYYRLGKKRGDLKSLRITDQAGNIYIKEQKVMYFQKSKLAMIIWENLYVHGDYKY